MGKAKKETEDEEEEDEEEEEEVVEKKPQEKAAPPAPPAPDTFPVAEPAPLGLAGLAVGALVLMSVDMGWSQGMPSLEIPWIFCMGAGAQLIAGIMDFQRKNVFGATVFCGFSMLWFGLGFSYLIILWGGVPFDTTHLTYAFIGFLFFGLLIMIATLATNKVFIMIVLFINLGVASLIAKEWYTFDARITGVLLGLVSALSFYASFAFLVNTMAKRVVVPLGGPLLKFN